MLIFDTARRLHDPKNAHDMNMLRSGNGCSDKVQTFQPVVELQFWVSQLISILVKRNRLYELAYVRIYIPNCVLSMLRK
jgi:hypothetical protein